METTTQPVSTNLNQTNLTPKNAPPPEPKKETTTGINTQPESALAKASVENSQKESVNQGETALKKWKLKVDGKEEEVPEQEVLIRAQKATAAEKRFQEAQATKSQAEQLLRLLKTDFTKLLDDPRLGLEEAQKRKMLEDYYKAKYIDPETLTPEQLRTRQIEQENRQYKEREQFQQQQKEQDRLQQLEAFHRAEYEKKFVEALKTQDIPQDEFAVQRMAFWTAKNQAMGLDLAPQDLAKLVKEDYQKWIVQMTSKLEGESLLNFFPPEFLDRLGKAHLARLRAAIPNVPQAPVQTPITEQPQTPKKTMTMDQLREERDKKAKELQANWKK